MLPEAKERWTLPTGGDRVLYCVLAAIFLYVSAHRENPTLAVVGALFLVCWQLSACVECLITLVHRHDERTELIEKARRRRVKAPTA